MSESSMLNYFKIILEKVSFDFELFKMEWAKASKYLLSEEFEELQSWVKEQFLQYYDCLMKDQAIG